MPMDGLTLIVLIALAAISLLIMAAIIKATVLSALRQHAKEQHQYQVDLINYQHSLQQRTNGTSQE
ncbi:hypothetical protein PQI23_12325 [Leucobacter sp. USCH14]|uniref:hypothetical protein n=1 Tax=Leucobacter sp. USCH14 TaxID=3024838 RepID=UPI00309C35ED